MAPWEFDSHMKMKYGPKRGFALGHVDPVVKNKRWRLLYPMYSELDQLVIDPPLKDSRVTLIDGVDTSREPGYPYIERYKGVPFNLWQTEVLYRQNPTIKNIYDKWDISPEHPGMQFRTQLRGEFTYAKNHGYFANTLGLIKNIGGRYSDAPNGEQCLVKTYAPMKFALAYSFAIWVYDLVSGSQPIGWKNQAKTFFKISSLPLAASGAWGATSCMLCNIRGKDDQWNYFWGGAAFGAMFGLRLGTYSGCSMAAIAIIVTMGWRMFIDYEGGFMDYGRRFNTNVGSVLSRESLKVETNWRDLPKEKRW